MSKLRLGLVLALVLALALVAGPACGDGDDEEEETPTPGVTVTPPAETPTPPPDGDGEGPGVGSTWEYLVDYVGGPYVDEIDHPYTQTLVQKGVAPKTDYVCVTADATVSTNYYELDTHSDGTCPAVTKPKRPMAGFVIILGTVSVWSDADDLTSTAIWAPVCMTAPMPLGLVNGEIVNTDYTAVSGTVGYPYAVGDKWTYNSTGNAEILGDCISETTTTPHTVEVVAVDVSVTVPAGTFTDCVEYVDTAEGATGSTTTWWSPTVQGAVKVVETESYAPGVQTQELASYDLK